MRYLLASCLLVVGCGVRMQDPCAGVDRACVAVQVEPSETLTDADGLLLWLSVDGVARPAQLVDDGKSSSLPVAIGLVFDSLPTAVAQLSVAVSGNHGGASYRSQTIVRSLAAGQHVSVRVQLTPQSAGLDGGGVMQDLATKADLADPIDLSPAPPPTPADMTTPIAARLISPASTATVTSQRPKLTWTAPAGGAVTDLAVDLCADRGCSGAVLQPVTVDASGTSGIPLANLPPGVVFWRVRASVAGVPTVSDVWQFYVGHISANVSTAYGTTLDYNGDGYADIVVGAWDVANGMGRAYAFPGGRRATIGSTNTILETGLGGGEFGHSVASAGDVDGDGYADVIVGSYIGVGHAYVFFGGSEGLDTAHYATLTNGTNVLNKFGYSVAGAGDIDGDGYGDVLVGTTGASGPAGTVYVFWGGPRATLGQAYAQIGFSSGTAAGDVDGDGFADVIANTDSGLSVFWGGSRDVFAAQTPTLLTPVVSTDSSDGSFGCAGDVDGDGYSEIIVGDPSNMAANVYFGGSDRTALSSTMQTITSTNFTASGIAGFGASVSSAGDMRAAGYSTVAVGAYSAANTAGAVYYTQTGGFIRGRSFEALGQVTNGSDGGQFGVSIAGVGDVDGDGYADLLVGANAFDADIGKAYLLFGPSGTTMLPLTNGADGGLFGGSVARLMRRPSASAVGPRLLDAAPRRHRFHPL